jgi:ribosome-binding protein aMBF1 (putative translation factor)
VHTRWKKQYFGWRVIFIAYFSLYLQNIFRDNFDMELNRIKEVLDEKGIKQTWLAEKLGKSFSMVNAYSCNRKQPTLEMLNRIADILQVSVKELIIDNDKLKNNGN